MQRRWRGRRDAHRARSSKTSIRAGGGGITAAPATGRTGKYGGARGGTAQEAAGRVGPASGATPRGRPFLQRAGRSSFLPQRSFRPTFARAFVDKPGEWPACGGTTSAAQGALRHGGYPIHGKRTGCLRDLCANGAQIALEHLKWRCALSASLFLCPCRVSATTKCSRTTTN